MRKRGLVGTKNPAWKGDSALRDSKRQRAQRAYKLGPCEHCGKAGTDRHHKDDDTGNNRSSNIEILCRACHMIADGRMVAFMLMSNSLRGEQPSKPCVNCKRDSKPLRHGRCHACNEYLRRRGIERPYIIDGRAEKTRRNRKAMKDMFA